MKMHICLEYPIKIQYDLDDWCDDIEENDDDNVESKFYKIICCTRLKIFNFFITKIQYF